MHSATLVHATDNGDDLISFMARVSNPDNQNNTETSAKLIRYLIKHKHWSPFEMVNMCVEIKTTRSIAAQILRHRSFSFQEFSQRYAEVTKDAYIPHLRTQDLKNRQNSVDDLNETDQQYYQVLMQQHFQHGKRLYDDMLKAGVAKECAREVLPLSTPTTMYMNGTLRSWLHYCDLRCGNGTQHEHKLVADSCKKLIYRCFPMVYEAMYGSP